MVAMMVLGFALTGLTGCGGGGGGGSSNTTSGYASVAGISNPTTLINNIFTGSYSRDLVITGSLVGQSGSGSYGPVGIQGSMTVTGSEWGIAPGSYSVCTTSPGYINGNVFSGQMQLAITTSSNCTGVVANMVVTGGTASVGGELALTTYVSGYYGYVTLITD